MSASLSVPEKSRLTAFRETGFRHPSVFTFTERTGLSGMRFITGATGADISTRGSTFMGMEGTMNRSSSFNPLFSGAVSLKTRERVPAGTRVSIFVLNPPVLIFLPS